MVLSKLLLARGVGVSSLVSPFSHHCYCGGVGGGFHSRSLTSVTRAAAPYLTSAEGEGGGMMASSPTATCPPGKVLSIQSHVVHGYVGNKAATFPLQLLGLEVDPLNSVQFSNHGGYPTVKGEALTQEQFKALIAGMKANNFFSNGCHYTHILSGYLRGAQVLEALGHMIKELREDERAEVGDDVVDSGRGFSYYCDPVLGDNGKLYVPEECVGVYKTQLLPLARVTTPNQFEVELLTGVKIETELDAIKACGVLHDIGPQTVIITSVNIKSADENVPPSPWAALSSSASTTPSASSILSSSAQVAVGQASKDDDEELCIFISHQPVYGRGSQGALAYRIQIPKIKETYGGCGDLFAALLLGHMHRMNVNNIVISDDDHHGRMSTASTTTTTTATAVGKVLDAVEKAVATVYHVLKKTKEDGSHELRLIQSKSIIDHPGKVFPALAVVPSGIAGVIFDLDGTLTMHGHIDFKAIRTRIGLSEHGDILSLIKQMANPADQEKAMAIVTEEELNALDRLELQPGLHDLINFLRDKRIRCAICTRNMADAVNYFMTKADLPHDTFTDIITRDFDFVKPDKRVALAVAHRWSLPAGKILFVGDHEDDMATGHHAGCWTAYVVNHENGHLLTDAPHLLDFKITELKELKAIIQQQPTKQTLLNVG